MPRRTSRRDAVRTGAAIGLASLAGCLIRLPGPDFGDDRHPAVDWERELDAEPRDLTADPGSTALFANEYRDTPFSYGFDGEERWRRDVDGVIAGVTGDRVVLDDSSAVTALDAATGSDDWSFETERHEIVRDLAVASDRVYVVGEKQATSETDPDEEFVRLYALDEGDGGVVWRRTLSSGGDSRERSVDATDDFALVARTDGEIRRFDADGSEGWRATVTLDDIEYYESEGTAKYWFSDGVVRDGTYYVGVRDALAKKVYAIGPGDGEVLWRRTGVDRVHAVGNDLAYCYSAGRDWQRKQAALDRDTGEERWSDDVSSDKRLVGATLADDVLYVSNVDSGDVSDGDSGGDEPSAALSALDASTGASRATVAVPGAHVTAPVVAGDRVFVGAGAESSEDAIDGGTLRALDGVHAGEEW